MLFNIELDPQEQFNLISIHKDISEFYHKKLENQLNALPKYIDEKYDFPAHFDKTTREKIKSTGYW
jgi:hypothetical protein